MDKDNIKKEITDQLPYLAEKYNVKRLGIFGSVARGDSRKDSDVDMLVEFKSPVGFFDFIRLENYLTESLGRKVDLVTKEALKPLIRNDVLNDVIYV